ncbi:MAG: type II CAAX endopeptidase family protein [Bacteroidales bacterium]|jgi:membrane protease YdiL (CAAX protease family)|nr:type II CAAX endopeptidase family protein [Bacteroidales bacterium]
MKDKLIVLGHIAAIIVVYILSFILPGIITGIIDFPERIDFLRIIVQALIAITIFVFGSKLYVEKIMKLKLSDLRVKFKKPDTLWIVAAVLVPASVVLFYFLTGRVDIVTDSTNSYHTIRFFTHILFVGGLCAGIVEEIFFRGILLGYLEKKYGFVSAVIISSLLFGAPHLLNVDVFSIALIIQVSIFIALYGVILSMIVYYTDNIWNTISIHIAWNTITGLIINQGDAVESNFVLQLKGKNLFWYGGDYGLDISIVGLIGISIFGFLVIIRQGRNSKKREITG